CHKSVIFATELAINPEIDFYEQVRQAKHDAIAKISQLQMDVKGPAERNAFANFKAEMDKYLILADGALALAKDNISFSLEEKMGLFTIVHLRMQRLMEALDPIFENRDDEGLVRQGVFTEDLKSWMWFGVATSVVLSCGLTLGFSFNLIRRVKHVRENSLRLAHGQELLSPLPGSDEIAELDRVFHRVATIFRDSFARETAIFDSAADLICCLDEEGKIERINTVITQSLGYAMNEVVGEHLNKIVHEDDRERMRDFLESARADEGSSSGIELRIVPQANHEAREYEWSARWEPSRQSFYCVAHDLTERKQLEQAKQDFVAMLSEDLQSPLANMRSNLDTIVEQSQDRLPEKCVDLLKMAGRSADRLVDLVTELLDLEKLEAGELRLVLAVVPISRVIENSVESLQTAADTKGVRLEVGESGNLQVMADENRLLRVFINLLSNAIKYSSNGDTIRIEAEQVEQAVAVLVIDEGAGIPAEFISQIFDPYRQVPGQENVRQGTGLGLAICKAIVDAHGGEIGVESVLNQGSTFWFRIPSAGES
ncbi:MAG: PAS domain-containing sensor histidine kinase, partial [Cyanobacteria bacterium]|nr:PAS domain-containing sensor histidine kinase [Cyanobacteriota bacterium]